ncbi:unnamed protein product [Pocillopora meandrina]|uniref:Ig-like domain-containing protein n=1 Tax=Pocillopora meandrina TaxID=46732 RepID=A0AAU9Y0A8_9CNID|nr:unnamed protein product [Pocillopora meandrina]
MDNHTVVKNGTIELYCNVSGTPPPTVLWTHVKSGETWNQKKWTISDIQVEELGEYRCNASNKYGGDIKSTFILYEDTPKKDFDVGLKLKGEFKQAYENLENPETKMMEEFKGTGLTSVKVLKLRQGGIIADLKLTFNDSVGESSVNALLTQAANRGKIGDTEVEEISVGKTFPEPTTTSVPPEDCGTFFEGEDCKIDLVTVPVPVPSEPAKVNKDAIYGSVIGVLAFMFAVAIILIAWKRRKREKDNRPNTVLKESRTPHVRLINMQHYDNILHASMD